MQHSSIKLFFALAVFGTLASLVALALPWVGVEIAFLSSAGEIAGGVAAVFGLAVAAIALKSYVWSESTERHTIDAVWKAVNTLKSAVFYYQTIAETLDKIAAETPERVGEIKNVLKKEAVQSLYNSSLTAISPDLVEYAEQTRPGMRATLNLFRIGLALSKASDWEPNAQVIGNLKTLWNWLKDQSFERISQHYK